MLYRNGDNLKSELIKYLSNKKDITIYVPYIKASMLNELLQTPGINCKQIIVRWEPKDIAIGASDIEVYNLCKAKNIALYMNNKIHLKLFTDNFNDAFLGSANISERALSNGENLFNYEICTYVSIIDREDRLYLHKILNESTLINDEIYNAIKQQIPEIDTSKENLIFKLPLMKNKDSSNFLISKLPMIDSPDLLWELYAKERQVESKEQENCLCHDLALYNIQANINNKEFFIKELSVNFLKHPFIINFLEAVDNAPKIPMRDGKIKEGLQFGAVTRWFSENTTTVPTPRSFELTNNVQILYLWIEYLSEGKYSITIPGQHSQVIRKN